MNVKQILMDNEIKQDEIEKLYYYLQQIKQIVYDLDMLNEYKINSIKHIIKECEEDDGENVYKKNR